MASYTSLALRHIISRAVETQIDRAPQPSPASLRWALAYWQDRRGGRRMPSRADLDPAHFPALLPHVLLIDVQANPLDFRYRLVGTGIVDRAGADHTGIRLANLAYQGPQSALWRLFSHTARAAKPACAEVDSLTSLRMPRSAEILAMPLSPDGAAINMLFCVVEFPAAPRH